MCSPIEYVPIHFREGLTQLVERKRTEFGETKKRAEKIKDGVFSRNSSGKEILSQDVIATLGKEAIVSKTRKMFDMAMQSIEYVSNWNCFVGGTIETYEEVKRALRRGVKGRTVTELPKNSLTIPKSTQKLVRDHSLEIRTVDSIPFIVLGIIDKKEIIFTPLQQRTTQANTYWSKNLGFVELANNYFETIWNKADPLYLNTL